jgi:hypothetical protein
MNVIALVQVTTTPRHAPRPLLTLGVALLFAAIFLLGGRASQVFGEPGLRRFHSCAAGIAVSYVFVYIMPELHAIRAVHLQSRGDYIQRLFPQYSAYLSALIGFLVFYGLENTVAKSRGELGNRGDPHGAGTPRQAWFRIGGFAIYTWLITFQIGGTAKGLVALCVFAVAMGLHIAPITDRLRREHPAVYGHRGAVVLALASIVGWACGLTLHLPGPLVLDMAAFVAGGVIVNTAIAELPREREASYWSFVVGATAYTALLLTLFHFDKGGHP